MANDPEAEDFAKGAAAALDREDEGDEEKAPEEGPKPEEKGKEAAGDDVSKLASELRKLNVDPERAREAMSDLALLKTPEGQQEYLRRFLQTDQGKQLQDHLGREYLAGLLAGNRQRTLQTLKEWGINVTDEQEQETADLSPEEKRVRDLERNVKAQMAEIQALRKGTEETARGFQAEIQKREMQAAFADWARSKPEMTAKHFELIAKHAYRLSRQDARQFGGAAGIKRAAEEALGELTSAGGLFAPRKGPKGLRSEGGGVAGERFDYSKLSFEDRAKLAAEDFEHQAKESEE